jgi:hypothetical protein
VPIAASVSFADHSETIKDLLERKLRAAVGAVAEQLADDYKHELKRVEAPPHSALGQIPHWYVGHKPGGFGPVFGEGEINNRPESGFSAVQSEPLASYIIGVTGAEGQAVKAFVGFDPSGSHVQSRHENYLIKHDQKGRPWVDEIFKDSRSNLKVKAIDAFEGTK